MHPHPDPHAQAHAPAPASASPGAPSRAPLARPHSVVLLAEEVRRARELSCVERLDDLKERVSDGDYAVSSKRLARRVLESLLDA